MSFLFKVTVSILVIGTIIFLIWNNQRIRKYDALMESIPSNTYPQSTNSYDKSDISDEEFDQDLIKIDQQIKVLDQDSQEVDQSMNE